MVPGVDTVLLVVPAEVGWEVVDPFGHRDATTFLDKDDAVAWSCDEAYRRWGRVVVCDDTMMVEADYEWTPPRW